MSDATPKLDAFTEAYIECALWADEPEDYAFGVIASNSLTGMIEDCAKFQRFNAELLLRASRDHNQSAGQAGHDFWLTRNHHGAGFWDRGMGEIGERLTESAQSCGDRHLYRGDDGLIYIDC